MMLPRKRMKLSIPKKIRPAHSAGPGELGLEVEASPQGSRPKHRAQQSAHDGDRPLHHWPGERGGGEAADQRTGQRVIRTRAKVSADVRAEDGGIERHQAAVHVPAEQQEHDAEDAEDRRRAGRHGLTPGEQIALRRPMPRQCDDQLRRDRFKRLCRGLGHVISEIRNPKSEIRNKSERTTTEMFQPTL